MAVVKTDDVNYKQIADKIRENLAGSEKSEIELNPSEMAAGVDEACAYQYLQGYEAGGGGVVPGENGLTPFIGENGNWWIGEEDTGVKANGVDGSNGITPHIGENGNWFIGENDTGVLARGKNGYTPIKGKDYFTDAEVENIENNAAEKAAEKLGQKSQIQIITWEAVD